MLRKKYIILLIVAVILLVISSASFCAPKKSKTIPGELIIKFKPGILVLPLDDGAVNINNASIKSSSIKNLNKKFKVGKVRQAIKKAYKGKKSKKIKSGKTVYLPDMSNIFILEIPKGSNISKMIKEYKNDPSVIYAEPNYIRHITVTPDDPDYQSGDPADDPNQWGLYKIGLGPTGSGTSGWDKEQGTNTVTVAVVDTGIDYNHPDLVGKAYSGWNFVGGNNNAADDHGHGTHVAGIVGAKTNNTTGVAGTDWNCRLMAVKSFNSAGEAPDSDIANGIIFAVNNNAAVINMSFGGYSQSSLIYDAISYAATSEVILIASAGNDNISNMNYPAAYSEVIAVAATNINDEKASYSNYGSWVAVSAPGGDTTKTEYIESTWLSTEGIGYAWLFGTSMAAPFVSGTAALITAQNPGWTKSQIDDRIKTYIDDIDSHNAGYAGLLGSGRINAFAALGGLYSHISSPLSGGTGYGSVQVQGTATGEGFSFYKVEYGLGSSPVSWTTAETSSSTKLNESLGSFDTSGTEGDYTARVIINDLATTEARVTFSVGSPHIATLVTPAVNGPNPFNPLTGSTMIKYELSSNASIRIYIFDMSGNLIWRKNYGSGTEGGWQGDNRVYWDGKDSFGQTVSNGVYLYKITAGNRVIGKGKIIVLK
ncbi:S8 family serine peptidase [Candidatus Margulisiibacteriota bacterium]